MPIGDGDDDLFLADFGVPWGVGGTQPYLGNLDTPDDALAVGRTNVISTMYELTAKSVDVAAANLKLGVQLTVNGILYKVREPLALDDGHFTHVELTRV